MAVWESLALTTNLDIYDNFDDSTVGRGAVLAAEGQSPGGRVEC